MSTSSVGKAYSSARHDKLVRNRMGVHLSFILFVLAVPSAIWQVVRRHEENDGPCESTPESTTAAFLIRSLALIEPRSNRCTRTPVAEQRNESNLLHRTIEDVASRIKERYRGPEQRIPYRVSTLTLQGEPTVE